VLVQISFQKSHQVHYYLRFLYDLLFFSLINIITVNIVFGVIIDAFACRTGLPSAASRAVQPGS
jgi:hypothetical protein